MFFLTAFRRKDTSYVRRYLHPLLHTSHILSRALFPMLNFFIPKGHQQYERERRRNLVSKRKTFPVEGSFAGSVSTVVGNLFGSLLCYKNATRNRDPSTQKSLESLYVPITKVHVTLSIRTLFKPPSNSLRTGPRDLHSYTFVYVKHLYGHEATTQLQHHIRYSKR